MQRLSRWLNWIREHRRDWPILVSTILFLLNVEIVVTPYILANLLGLDGRELRLVAGTWSDIEMCWWIYFSVWLANEKMRRVGRPRILKDILKPKDGDKWWLARSKGLLNKYIVEKFDLENYKSDKFFKALSDSLKGYGYLPNVLFIFIFALVPGFWALALMVCRITKWMSLYAVLMLGNFLKNYFFAYVYELIGFWWLLALIFLVSAVTAFITKKVVINIGGKL